MADDWRGRALCAEVGGTVFDLEGEGSQALAQANVARMICVECDVREQCLAWALQHNESRGMWGGLTPKQRRQLLKGNYAT